MHASSLVNRTNSTYSYTYPKNMYIEQEVMELNILQFDLYIISSRYAVSFFILDRTDKSLLKQRHFLPNHRYVVAETDFLVRCVIIYDQSNIKFSNTLTNRLAKSNF